MYSKYNLFINYFNNDQDNGIKIKFDNPLTPTVRSASWLYWEPKLTCIIFFEN